MATLPCLGHTQHSDRLGSSYCPYHDVMEGQSKGFQKMAGHGFVRLEDIVRAYISTHAGPC